MIRLDDLCVALRAFPPSGSATKLIGCSIDPTKEGLAAMQRFLRSIGSNADPRDAQRTQFIVEGLQSNLGLQTVSVNGVSAKTHFAVVMVEADYRMKLIGIGLEKPPVKLVSWVDRANAAPDQPQRPGPLVLHARLRMRADQHRRHRDGACGRRREGRRRGRDGRLQRAAHGRRPGQQRQPRLRAGLYQGLFRVGRASRPSMPSCGT